MATTDSEMVLDVPVQDQGDSAETQKPKQSQWLVTRRMKLFLAIGSVSALIGSLIAWRYYAARETTDNAQVDGYITVVSARVSGTAQQVNFNNDDVIEKDQILVQLAPADYQAQQLPLITVILHLAPRRNRNPNPPARRPPRRQPKKASNARRANNTDPARLDPMDP